MQTPDGAEHFLCRDDNDFLQLCVRGSIRPSWVHLLTEAVAAPETLRARLHALEVLNHLWHKGRFPEHSPSIAPASDRFRFVLRALDGSLAGASYREIAVVILGGDRVKASWGGDDGHLKNRIRRAVRRGRLLMSGDYKRLLSRARVVRGLGAL